MDAGACLAASSGAGVGLPLAVLEHARLAHASTVGGTATKKDTSAVTPVEEARFIALWNEGLPTTAIAQRLGIPEGTVKSRAHTLQQGGKIQPQPKGGPTPTARAGPGTMAWGVR